MHMCIHLFLSLTLKSTVWVPLKSTVAIPLQITVSIPLKSTVSIQLKSMARAQEALLLQEQPHNYVTNNIAFLPYHSDVHRI